MTIRIKGKHLVYSGVVLLVIILVIANFGGSLMYQYANLLDKMGNTEKANVYYARISKLYSKNSSGLLAEYKLVQNILLEGNFKYFTSFSGITNGATSTSGYIGYKTVDSVNAQYEILKNNKKVNQTVMGEYTIGVALVNWFGGRSDQAVGLLKSFNPADERLQELKKLHLSNMYFYLGETGKSRQVNAGMKPFDGLTDFQDDIKALDQLFAEESDKITFEHGIIYTYDGDNADCLVEPLKFTRNLIESLQSFTTKPKSATKGNVLTGRIMYDGIPQKSFMVFIQQAEYKNSWSSNIGMGDGIVGMGISDDEGYFEIADIPDGVYGMVLNIPWQRITGKNIIMHSESDMAFSGSTTRNEDITLSDPIQVQVAQQDGKITFRWNGDEAPVDSYSLVISELTENDGMTLKTNNSHYIQNISGNDITIDLKDTQKKAYRLGFANSGKPDPNEYIEPLYHTGQYGYTLYSFERQDMLYFTSEGIYPNKPPAELSIQGSEWTKEDLLLLDGKFEEARVAYEALLEKEPENIHALKVLSRVYDFGYIVPEGVKFPSDFEGRDETRALELLQRLDSLVDSIDIKSALENQYRELKQYSKAIDLLTVIQARSPSAYNELEIGRMQLYMDKFPESVEHFKKFTQEGGSGSLYQFLLGVLLNDNGLISEGATYSKIIAKTNINDLAADYISIDKSEYQEFFELVRQNKIPEAQEWLSERKGEMDTFLRAVLLLTRDNYGISYEENETSFRELHQQIKDPVLNELLICFGRELISSTYMTPLDNPEFR